MNLTISWVNQKDFFTDKNVTNPVYIKSARTVTDYYRVNSLKSLPWGEEALVRPNIFPIGQNYELLKEQGIDVIMYSTKYNNYCNDFNRMTSWNDIYV